MERSLPHVQNVFADLPPVETERLLLRKVRLEDAADVFEYARDPEVSKYTIWGPHRSIEESRAFMQWLVSRYQSGEVADWGMVHKPDRKLIGTCGFVSWLPAHGRAEIGYAMSRRYWGRGLMTEAVRAVIAFGFRVMQLNRIEARCLPANIGSARVMEKCGMSFEGILREHIYTKGRYHDLKLYSILRREWDAC